MAVYGILTDGDCVLLMRRAGSGYRDGQLSVPAGHLDGGEDALSGLIRELREELTIAADPASCRLAVTVHRAPETATDSEYLDLFFTVERWAGTPAIGEPDKCTELVWARKSALPSDLIDYVATALNAADNARPLLLHGWTA
ncbi:ADP-ribose pyrophosphatase YjhB (NUDIX family) [Nakamurella sp. UYEF19]|uniref:NUDIX hydrolase n=1 Tax=Nakamurella sp. UYEF19 TaxID=1756392 RepID=UPI003391FA39